MSDQNNPTQPDAVESSSDAPKWYQHPTATRVVPMQRDHLGQRFWESYHSPSGFEVRAECRIPPHMPGVIIFVHGVNSEGEWYDDAEKALCDGLNERLNRSDGTKLKENRYITFDKETDRIIPRKLDPSWEGNSPVIRFYWGYRAPEGKEKDWRITLRNEAGLDYWAPQCGKSPWYWGGGPFQNGTNNLGQLWSKRGMKRHVLGFDMEKLNSEADRQVQDAPPRDYYAHAAKRLADLIDSIREKCPRDTVTVMSHSQGTMIALAATTLCKERAPDALFVMNSPYALEDKVTDALTAGMDRPTQEARVKTLRNIANRIQRDKRVFTDVELKQLQCGASEDMDYWRPDNQRQSGIHERDNHGRLYVYFNPHDRVMGLDPLQSIGWQGISDEVLATLGDNVKQRMLARSTPVGDAPGVKKFGTLPPTPVAMLVPGAKPTDFWNGNRNALPLMPLWAVPKVSKTVTINAEQVPQPLTADEMASFEISRVIAPKMGEVVTNPDDPNFGKYVDPEYRFMRSIAQPTRYVVVEDIYTSTRTSRLETQEELLQRLDAYRAEPTNHSTLPKQQEFMRRVAAYDLPIGFCDAYEKQDFWADLMKRADWTQGYDPYFKNGDLQNVPKPDLIDWDTVAEEQSRLDAERFKKQQYAGA